MPGHGDRAGVLLLGGTGEALALATALAAEDVELLYSLAGVGAGLDAPCAVRVGGFGGVQGMVRSLRERGIGLLVDATHPYAAIISLHAVQAAASQGIPCWALRREPWAAGAGDDWYEVEGWVELLSRLSEYQRPFFTIGQAPLAYAAQRPPQQTWLVRTLAGGVDSNGIVQIAGRGPFTLAREQSLMSRFRVDVLVSKNSGGDAVAAKLEAARNLAVPVLMLERPEPEAVDREFADVAVLRDAVLEYLHRSRP